MERRNESQSLDFTMDNVEKALHQLYYDPNIENKNLAQKWLMQAQVSPQAWQFSWQLLSGGKVPEIQYFGASALHIKISRYWGDIPSDQYETLKSQLFTQISAFASGSKIVLTRLCVALASLALNMMPDTWPHAVPDMVRVFQTEDGQTNGGARCLALLELLTVLPEEFQTSRLPPFRKGQVRSCLAQESACIFPLLRQLLQQSDSPGFVKQKVLKCFSSWAQLGIPLTECEELTMAAFNALRDPELFDAAVEALVNTISQPDAQSYIFIIFLGPRNHPDIVDSFMQLLAQALKRKPCLFLSAELDVKAVFQCAILSLKFPEPTTVKSSCAFFMEFLPRCGELAPVGQVVHDEGKFLLQATLEGIGGQASRNLMDSFADMIFSLNKNCFSYLVVWLKELLQQAGFPSPRLTQEQKDNFSQHILRERVNKRRMRDMVKEFTLLCRGLHGTEYTADY
ncbi:importin-13 [Lithobates pipiens]